MAWALAWAFLALFLIWIVAGFVAEMAHLSQRREELRQRAQRRG